MSDSNKKPQYLAPSSDEFRGLLKKWELSGSKAGNLIDSNGRAIRRYTGADTKVSYPILFTLIAKNEGVMVSADKWREELQEIS